MGLDMWFKRISSDGDYEELKYYRKHSDLHGFMMDHWLKENPDKTYDDFNMIEYDITPKILHDLEEECNKVEHKKYSGFFWGESVPEDWEDTKNELIPMIKQCLDDEERVIYDCWW